MDQQSHLSDEQIERCSDQAPGSSPQELEEHLSGCSFCLDRLLRWQRMQLNRFAMTGIKQEPYPDCPDPIQIHDVATDTSSPEVTSHILQHAAQCDHCGPLLKQYLQIFSEESAPEMDAIIQQLPSSHPGWDKEKAWEIARQISQQQNKQPDIVPPRPPVTVPGPWLTALRLRYVALGFAVLVLAIGIRVWQRGMVGDSQLVKTKNLVAAATAAGRMTEMHSSDAHYGPYQPGSKMGAQDDADGLKRPAVNRAYSALSDILDSESNPNPEYFRLQGELLLQKNPANAKASEDAFLRAESKGLKGPNLDIDLAIAYFEDDIRNQPDKPFPNVSRSIDLLNKVLAYSTLTHTQKSTALFNLAIAYEKSRMCNLAVKTWKSYLETDSKGPWADEARSRLEIDQKCMQNARNWVVLKDPAAFLAYVQQPGAQVNAEDYLKFAGTSWLLAAMQDAESPSFQAYSKLADLLKKNTLMGC